MQSRLYKNHFFCIFFAKNLHISKKSSTFAPDLKNKTITIIKLTIMEKKHVYQICSIKEETNLIFSSQKKAENWIKDEFNEKVFTKSNKSDLFISKRVLF